MIYDHELFPSDLKEEIYTHLRSKFTSEKKETDTDEQFIYKTRKKGFGEFKSRFWNLSDEIKSEIGKNLESKVEYLFKQLKVDNTLEIVEKAINPVRILPNLDHEIASA